MDLQGYVGVWLRRAFGGGGCLTRVYPYNFKPDTGLGFEVFFCPECGGILEYARDDIVACVRMDCGYYKRNGARFALSLSSRS
jgi:hypothetical protein